MKAFFAKCWTKIKEWWGPAQGAILNHINVTEAVRIAIAAMVAGGSASQIILLFYDHVGDIAKDSTTASILSFIVVLLAETVRRLRHEDANQAALAEPPDLGKLDDRHIK